MKLSDRPKNKYTHAMIYGAPKSGKTQLVGELAKKFNLYWFDLESGIDTLKKLPEEDQARIEVYAIPNTKSFPIAIDTCSKVIRGGKFEICEKHGTINCGNCKKHPEEQNYAIFDTNLLSSNDIVVFDSITELTASGISLIGKNYPEGQKFEFDDWARLSTLMDGFFSHVQNAPFNVVCISHETEVETEDGKEKLVPTAGSRNFSRNVAKYFGEVIRLDVKNKKHIAYSSSVSSGTFLTGSRTGAVLELDVEPSLIPIFLGEVKVQERKENNTPAQSAVAGLKKLTLSMKS